MKTYMIVLISILVNFIENVLLLWYLGTEVITKQVLVASAVFALVTVLFYKLLEHGKEQQQ